VILARFRGIWLLPPSAGLVKNPRSKLIRASNRATNPVTVYHVRQFPGKPSLGHTRRRLRVSWPPDARKLRWDGRGRKERPLVGGDGLRCWRTHARVGAAASSGACTEVARGTSCLGGAALGRGRGAAGRRRRVPVDPGGTLYGLARPPGKAQVCARRAKGLG